MRGSSILLLSGSLALLLQPPAPAHASWPHDPSVNVPLCTAPYSQATPQVVADGAGGVIATWYDQRNGFGFDIYAQRVSAAGVPLWTEDGVALCTAANVQEHPTIVADGAGGAIVAWTDYRGGNSVIYAQRVSAAGVPLWTPDGVPLCSGPDYRESPAIVADGAGGAIVAWMDGRGGSGYDIYAQRVDAAGVPQWTADGVALCTVAENQYYPTIVSDGSGGAIITWYDYRSGTSYDIYAQRVNSAGSVQWTHCASSKAVSSAGSTPSSSRDAELLYWPLPAAVGSAAAATRAVAGWSAAGDLAPAACFSAPSPVPAWPHAAKATALAHNTVTAIMRSPPADWFASTLVPPRRGVFGEGALGPRPRPGTGGRCPASC